MELSTESRNSQTVSRGDWLSFGAWWILLVFGYCYVAGILCQRDNPFRSGNPGFSDFVFVALVGPLLFSAGPRHHWKTARFSAWEIFRWNDLCYLLPFFLVLHWEYLGDAIGTQFSLKPADLRSLDSRSTAALAVAISIITTLLTFHLVWAHRAAILYPYVACLCGILCLIWGVTVVLGGSHYIHVHHYCLGAFLFSFFQFRNFLSLVAQAVFLGLAVEGISRWGIDPMWYSTVVR